MLNPNNVSKKTMGRSVIFINFIGQPVALTDLCTINAIARLKQILLFSLIVWLQIMASYEKGEVASHHHCDPFNAIVQRSSVVVILRLCESASESVQRGVCSAFCCLMGLFVRTQEKERGREVCDLTARTVSEGVTIRSPSHSSRQADCAANCGLGGWRPTDRMESCNTKEKQFGSSTQ